MAENGTSGEQKVAHALLLQKSLGNLRENDCLCDFTIRVKGRSYSVHRVVLAALSEYFKAMFIHNMREASQSCVELRDMERAAFEECLHYMYTGELRFDKCSAVEILHAACLFQLAALKRLCFDKLRGDMSSENCWEVLKLAEIYSCTETEVEAERFLRRHILAVMESDCFLNLAADDVLYFLDMTSDADAKWKAVSRWTKRDFEAREAELPDLLHGVNMDNLSLSVQAEVLEGIATCQSASLRRTLLDLSLTNVMTNITISNCFPLRRALMSSSEMRNKNLMTSVTLFMGNNFEKISVMDDSVHLNIDEVLLLLRTPEEEYSSEEVKWNFSIYWVQHDVARAQHFPELLRCIKLERFSRSFFDKLLSSDNILHSSRTSIEILLRAKQTCNFSSDPTVVISLKNSASLLTLEPTRGLWMKIPGPTKVTEFHAITVSNNNLFLMCGKQLFYYSSNRKEWKFTSTLASTPWKHSKLVDFTGNRFALLSKNGTILFDYHANSWSEDLPGNELDKGFSAALLGDAVYAVGGYGSGTVAKKFVQASKTWKHISPAKHWHEDGGMAALHGRLFLAGGLTHEFVATTLVQCYNPTTDSWETIQGMSNPRKSFSLFAAMGKIYAVGGTSNKANVVEVYDDELDKWETLKSAPRLDRAVFFGASSFLYL